jgi:hypothetical protein
MLLFVQHVALVTGMALTILLAVAIRLTSFFRRDELREMGVQLDLREERMRDE